MNIIKSKKGMWDEIKNIVIMMVVIVILMILIFSFRVTLVGVWDWFMEIFRFS